MKRFSGLLLAVCVVFFATQTLYAGVPQVQQGAKSIFWGFNGLADLSVQNSVVGAQYNIADRIGIWASLGLDMTNTSSTYEGKTEDEEGISLLHFSVGAKLYLFRNEPVAFFVSPIISLSSGSTEDKTSSSKHINSSTSFGIGVGAGAEWWFTDNVSLTAASYLGFNSITNTAERGSSKTEETATSIGTFNNFGSSLTISFYF